jgi:hypothetical protein
MYSSNKVLLRHGDTLKDSICFTSLNSALFLNQASLCLLSTNIFSELPAYLAKGLLTLPCPFKNKNIAFFP